MASISKTMTDVIYKGIKEWSHKVCFKRIVNMFLNYLGNFQKNDQRNFQRHCCKSFIEVFEQNLKGLSLWIISKPIMYELLIHIQRNCKKNFNIISNGNFLKKSQRHCKRNFQRNLHRNLQSNCWKYSQLNRRRYLKGLFEGIPEQSPMELAKEKLSDWFLKGIADCVFFLLCILQFLKIQFWFNVFCKPRQGKLIENYANREKKCIKTAWLVG